MRPSGILFIIATLCAAHVAHGLPVTRDSAVTRDEPLLIGFPSTNPVAQTSDLKPGVQPESGSAQGKRAVVHGRGSLVFNPTADTASPEPERGKSDKARRGEKRAIPERAAFIITDPTADTKDLKKDGK